MEFLSNYFPAEIEVDGEVFPTAEHAFQAAKTQGPMEALAISRARTPGEAKRLGRKVTMRYNWEDIKIDVMTGILRLKFAPRSQLATRLQQTGTEEIIEGNNWHDQFWGSCSCEHHVETPGQNHLGKILVRVRNDLV
jgi:N-glycosidase YbiA